MSETDNTLFLYNVFSFTFTFETFFDWDKKKVQYRGYFTEFQSL